MSALLSRAIVAAVMSIASAAVPGAQPSVIVATATVAGRTVAVTADELRLEVLALRRAGDPLGGAAAGTVDGLAAVTGQIVERKLLAAEARHREIDRDTIVDNMIVRGIDTVLVQVLTQREAQALDLSNAAIATFYERHGEQFRSPPRRRARHIVVASEDEVRAARAEIASGRSFAEVAMARNTDGTGKDGGALGWIAQGAMVKTFDSALFRLAKGEVSAPVQTSMGWHLILVDEIDDGYLPSVGLVREQVVEAMKRDALTRLATRLLSEGKPVVDRAALEGLLQ